jgi:hypothetical protein
MYGEGFVTAIVATIVGFILTGLVGNRLVQAWQQRNWLAQQRFLGHEKEYIALKELVDEIASLLGARIYHTQRLLFNLLRSSEAELLARIAEYDDVVKRWNERLTTFYVRLPLLAGETLAPRLDSRIQARLARTGRVIDEMVYRRRRGEAVDKRAIGEALTAVNSVQGTALKFNKELLRIVERRRIEVYYGTRIRFTAANLERFSTWQLIKALFMRDINSLSVLCPTLDLDSPIRGR